MVPDVDIAAQVGRDFFLDKKIPRHKSGKGYVRVVEHSVMWKETAASRPGHRGEKTPPAGRAGGTPYGSQGL
jgi:hypothetical protein